MVEKRYHLKLKIKTIIGDWEGRFSRSSKAKDILQAAVRHFGFAKSSSYVLRQEHKPGAALILSRSLNKNRIRNGDVLVLEVLDIVRMEVSYDSKQNALLAAERVLG